VVFFTCELPANKEKHMTCSYLNYASIIDIA
jgi:hypothetical protein